MNVAQQTETWSETLNQNTFCQAKSPLEEGDTKSKKKDKTKNPMNWEILFSILPSDFVRLEWDWDRKWNETSLQFIIIICLSAPVNVSY